MKLRICMLLPPGVKINERLVPQIGICSYLANFGHKVTWVTNSKGSRHVQSFFVNNIHVYATPEVQYFSGSSLLIKIINMIPNIFRKMRIVNKMVTEEDYDVIVVIDFAYHGLIAAYIKWRFKIPFVYTLRNPLEQDWESAKLDPRWPKLLYYLVTKVNSFTAKFALSKADLILTISQGLKQHLVKQGIPESKVKTYANGVDMEVFSNRKGTTIRSKYQLNKSRVIAYVGSLGKARNLNTLIEAFTKVKEKRKNVKLLIIGEGTDKQNLMQLTTEMGVTDDVIFTGQILASDIPDYIMAADIGICPIPPLSFYKLSSPIKLFEYMGAAKAVVANKEIPSVRWVLQGSGGGILVPFAPEAFASAIIELIDDPDRTTEMGRRNKEWVVKHRSYEILARRLERLFIRHFKVNA